MGIGVETSMRNRTLAELASGAVDHDADKDESHAGHAEKVREVLHTESGVGVRGVRVGGDVNDHVEDSGANHDQQAELRDRRDAAQLIHSILLYQ
jgi:hypothetical protein